MPDPDHLYLVTYDIRSPRRWRRIFRVMKGYGEWLQLSVFQCRLSPMRHAELISLLMPILNLRVDHLILIDLGRADKVKPKVVSLGKDFTTVEREPIIV